MKMKSVSCIALVAIATLSSGCSSKKSFHCDDVLGSDEDLSKKGKSPVTATMIRTITQQSQVSEDGDSITCTANANLYTGKTIGIKYKVTEGPFEGSISADREEGVNDADYEASAQASREEAYHDHIKAGVERYMKDGGYKGGL